MRFSKEQKERIISYLLEKIVSKQTSLTKHVADEFGIKQNTVYTYINELIEQGIIIKVKRGEYILASDIQKYELLRARGELTDDMGIYEKCFSRIANQFAPNVRTIWEYTFTEMINNVIDHSECDKAHITVIKNQMETMVIIEDDGVGIFEKIRNYFGYSTTEVAVCELFKGKLTTDSENHSGEGIFFSSKMMDSFCIISSGNIFAVNKYDDSFVSEYVNQKGTTLIMTLANESNKVSREVFDLYSDVNSGFTKTKIPLKNIFASDPVSRSQAKRVCNRLTEFQEVEFDFSGVEWMGQGFADQIFRVFQNQNPTIKLVVTNMSEGVENMYRHVVNTN